MRPFKFFFGISLAVIVFFFVARFVFFAFVIAAVLSFAFFLVRKMRSFLYRLDWPEERGAHPFLGHGDYDQMMPNWQHASGHDYSKEPLSAFDRVRTINIV